MARQIEIRSVAGLAEALSGLLPTPQSRRVVPQGDLLEQVTRVGNAFILEAAKQPENGDSTIYSAFQWPDDGPIELALIWAVNTRHSQDRATGGAFFFRAYTETRPTHEHLLSVDEMEDALVEYAAAQFGRPKAV